MPYNTLASEDTNVNPVAIPPVCLHVLLIDMNLDSFVAKERSLDALFLNWWTISLLLKNTLIQITTITSWWINVFP